jgi:hypothetical protein
VDMAQVSHSRENLPYAIASIKPALAHQRVFLLY